VKWDTHKTLFLIDGSSFLYRAYYGLKPLHTLEGIPVQAVFSFCRMIKKLLDTYKPEYIVLVWDSKGKTTRHEVFADYKATRQAPPSDLFEQKKYIIRFAELIGMRQYEKPGYEADDLMFSLAKEWMEHADNAVVFVTLDKDMGQALTLGDRIYLLDAFKDQLSDRDTVHEKMGFHVKQIPFYFALVGDASDNIPGVKGIGKKTATDLVNQFDSLEDMYNRIYEIKKAGVQAALSTYKDDAFLSYSLFLLQYYPTHIQENEMHFNAEQWNDARPLFEELNFSSLLKQAGQTKQERMQTIQEVFEYWKQRNFITVTTSQQLQELCAYLRAQGAFAFDTETTGLQPLSVDLVGISVCADEERAYYIPCGHITKEKQLPLDEIVQAFKPLLEDAYYKKYFHNAKYDQLVMSRYGIETVGVAFDTLLASQLVLPEKQSAGLKNVSYYFFKEHMITYEDVVKGHNYKNFAYVPHAMATLYSCADSYQTFRLVARLQQELTEKPRLAHLYYTIELPLLYVLYGMEKRGVSLNCELLQKLDGIVTQEIIVIEKEIAEIAGKEKINLNSPSQVENLLFYTLQLPPQKKSKTGKFSTDYEVLKVLATLHPVPGLIIKHRELAKLKSTYIDSLPHYVNPYTHNIHTTFSQTAVATGRLASSHPNLQNIPADATGYGIQVRAAFQAEEGKVFISADYSQIELRVLAYLSQDENLIHAFVNENDIHTETAARLFDVALTDVTHEQRQLGKRINFSILYGLTPYGLSKDLGISFTEAKKYINRYFAQYPQVSTWMESIIQSTKDMGYVETIWGRRRYISAIYEKNRTLYEEACRVAINTVAQGTAAEIVKLGMLAVNTALQNQFPDAHILLQIHDELLISAPLHQVTEVESLVQSTLESVVSWNVPLVVMTSIGQNWKEVT